MDSTNETLSEAHLSSVKVEITSVEPCREDLNSIKDDADKVISAEHGKNIEASAALQQSPSFDEIESSGAMDLHQWRVRSEDSESLSGKTGPDNEEATVDVTDIGVTSPFRGAALLGDDDEISITRDTAKSTASSDGSMPPRPPMRKIQFRPPPPHQPPLPPGSSLPLQNAPDSLSIAQLKKIVSEMPKIETTAYAFTYEDTASFPEELEEWFSYSGSEQSMLEASAATFAQQWEKTYASDLGPVDSAGARLRTWTSCHSDRRKRFIGRAVSRVEASNIEIRVEGLETLLYIALGAWKETAGLKSSDVPLFMGHGSPGEVFQNSTQQIKWIIKGTKLIHKAIGIPVIFDALRGASSKALSRIPDEGAANGNGPELNDLEIRELDLSLTLMYFLVESGRHETSEKQRLSIRDDIAMLDPNILIFQVRTLAKLRWKETAIVPINKFIMLFWKSLLLLFGDISDLKHVKESLAQSRQGFSVGPEKPTITASSLDYHLFRQEIISKYPAYNPPPPLIPLELENSSILPTLSSNRAQASIGPLAGIHSGHASNNGSSILQQPVHIATPAPSPPPSPVGPGGKAGKKQNYQTNQNFPFLYPPLDASSNIAGGKGVPALQQMLVGRKWEGSDIPESILEAGKLFSSRTRMSRSTRQLWNERERFMKYDRGWESNETDQKRTGHFLDTSDLSAQLQSVNLQADEKGEGFQPQNDSGSKTTEAKPLEPAVQKRLDAVEEFYGKNLSLLQSLVIVLLKEVLANVTFIVNNPNTWANNALAPGFQEGYSESNGMRMRSDSGRQTNGTSNLSFSAIEAIDAARQREISSKAVSGTLMTLLKWFKLSHVLKYEYLTQLLLDSNYLPLILKLFAHQDIDRVIDSKTEHQELGFFTYCQRHSNQPNKDESGNENDASEDDAAPPPIKLKRNESSSNLNNKEFAGVSRRPPEVDELGHPTSDLPNTPITSFSWRNFCSTINSLRIMQKVVRHKTHRNLLLVHYKSSTILRKLLKVPQHEMRLYTLKLFKGQVPYCGRKWRQSNMRVITAVYLHVAPELRDDWLAGGDVDNEVEEALPLEQALRALTHWWHCIEYPDQMGADEAVLEGDMDFFARELDKMDWGLEEGAEEMAREDWEGTAPLVEGW